MKTLARRSLPWYRIYQFVAALRAHISHAEYTHVNRLLSSEEQRLFYAMPVYDQRHCLDVYATLQAAGHTDELLLRAALFHDCGKVDDDGRPMPLRWYVGVTLLKRLARPLYYAAATVGHGPFHPIRIYAEHAWRGAQMATAAGSPPEIVETLRHYHDVAPVGRAALLQWADEQQ